jgi:hypothetical protein
MRFVISFLLHRPGFDNRSCGGLTGQSGIGASFLVPILILPTAPQSSSAAGTIGQIVIDVPSGLSLTPTPYKLNQLIKIMLN